MKRAILVLALLSSLAGSRAVSQDSPATPPLDSAPGFRWPIPQGWNHETFALPPDFASQLPYAGTEELRFMPGFYKPAESDYWSYDLVWWVVGPPAFDSTTVAAALTTYFRGLATAVGGAKYHFDPGHFRSSISPNGRNRLGGQVFTYDPFTTGEAIILNVELSQLKCAGSGHSAIIVALSPKAPSDDVWVRLRATAGDFTCS